MDSEPFVGDFGLGMPLDNRYMNLGGMGAMATGGAGANDLMNPAGLDFSSSMMMMDSNASLVGPPGSSTGMIDFPDELNSPKNASSTAALSGATTNASMSVSSDAGALGGGGGDGAIPFPASLANDTSLTMNATATNAAVQVQAAQVQAAAQAQAQAVQNQNRVAAMNGGSAPMNFTGMDMNASAMNVNMNPAMNGGVNMSMPMNMGMAPGYMPDMNMGFAMNPMFMNGGGAYNPMAAVQPQQMNGMMVNMGNGQMYFQPQQQQQEYLRMLQQQRQSQLQFATMQQQQQQQLAKAQQAQQAQAQQQVAGQQNNAAAVAQLQRQQQMQALQQQMAMQQQQQAQAQANSLQAGGPVATAQQLQQQQRSTSQQQQHAQANAVAAGVQRQFQAAPGQPQQQQQQQPAMPAALAPHTSSGVRQPWHSPADHALRREMSNHIMRVLQSQKSNAPANWLQRLPEMARRLEDECYRISTSREEYANTSTLQSRLKNIVRAAQSQQRGRVSTPSGPMSQAPSMTTTATSATTTNAARPNAASSPALSPMPIPFPGAEAVKPAIATPVKQQPNMAAAQPLQMPAELQGPGPSPSVKMETPQAIPMPLELQIPTAAAAATPASASTAQATAQANAKQAMFDAAAASNAVANQSRSAQFLRQFKARAQHVTSSLEEEQKREYHNKLQSMTTSDVMNANSKGVLQRQQQRLLLLRHAMSCKAPDGTCVATPSCGEMKRLWQHMGNCKETTPCAYSHCISSKYVLSHFQQCENMRCLVCQLLRYPVEVKEKNGALIMDTDRALQQIQAATERRLAHQGHSLDPTTNSTAPTAPTAPTTTKPPQQPQQQQPFQHVPNAVPGQPQMQQIKQQPAATPPVTSQAMQPPVQQTMMNGRPSMNMPPSANQAVAVAATPPISGATPPETNVPGLTEEENQQLAHIQQRLGGVSLEQLTHNSKKLESYAEQMRSKVTTLMNECRQLMQMRNTTQDPAMQTQFDSEVQTKKATLQELHQKYKKCTSQHRIVKHVISARLSGAPIGGVAASPVAQPVSQPPQAPSVPTSTSTPATANGHGSFPVNMQPLSMPPGLQAPQAPTSQPAQHVRTQGPTQVQASMQRPLQQSFSAQLQQAQGSLVQSQAPVISQGPTQLQQQRSGVTSQAANDILGQSLGMPLGSNDSPMPMPVGLAAAGSPLEMPSELSMTSKPLAMPESLQSAPTRAAQPAPPAPAVAKPKKAEPTVNPLTMNNSKLNAMMMEHKRMDAAKVKLEPAGVTVAPATTTAIVPVPSAVAAPSSGATPASGDVPTSMLNELTNEELKDHIDSLIIGYNATMQPLTLKKRLEGLLKGMMDHKFGWVFSSPVDPVALGIPDYFKIIRRPMDLGTVKKKLDAGVYKHTDQFAHDVRTTFENAKTFNREDQDVYNLAKDMLNDFNAELRKLEAEIHADEVKAREGDSACRLCGVERMLFEPAVLYCNGECNSRIRRNCYYFCAPDNKYHCCQPCMANVPDTVTSSEGKPYKKTELTKKKNDEVHEEPWVQCDTCNRWVHQICALFNGKIDAEKKPQVIKSDPTTGKAVTPGPTNPTGSAHSISSTPGSEFLCPECLLDHRLKEPQKYTIGKHAFSAKDLMRTKLSDFLERRIYKALQEEREDEARWTNKDIKEIATAEHLTVRLVSNIEKQLMVRDKMFQRYKNSHKYTSEHRFKSKCICMFQEIHGVSVLLFGMYVHEFDEQEADCNSRRVYISYLDSVNYFEPAHLRTKVYHEVLVAYMEFVRQRGFHTAHLWACPPLKGDDYILYCHPESQKTPKSDRLRQWYVDMLIKAQSEGIALHISNLYDEYWRNNNTACALPYFEGDYWVGLAEEAIEKIDAEKPKKKKAPNKRKASEMKKTSKKSKAKKTKRRKTSTAGSVENGEDNGTGSDGDDGEDAEEETTETCAYEPVVIDKKEKPLTSLDDVDRTVTDPLMKKMGEIIEPMKDDFLVVKLQPYCRLCNTPVLKGTLWRDPTTSTELGLNPKKVHVTLCGACYDKAKASPSAKLQDQLKRLVSETVTWPEKCTDPDEINDSEYFDTRQAFLSLCQGNHYQFDELRRAKHSSMMALYHLGNPNPNAYVYECNACTHDIVSGNRWHCHTCPDFDVCDACYAKEKHEHALEKIPTSGVAGAKGKGGGGKAHGALTDEQRRLREQRAKNVRLHMQLLVHASGCDGSCGSANCEKMKELMRHGAHCKLRALGGCTVCRRVWALLQLHARQCRQYECKVPRCHDLREHVRKLQLQQQLMDDRRRAAVTQQYRQMQNGGPVDGTGDDGERAGGGGGAGGP